MSNLDKKNNRVGVVVAGTAALMVGMAYAAVPLYELFCQVTGYGGTTQEVAAADNDVIDRDIKVRFSANTHRDMPWVFEPSQGDQFLKVGEQGLAYYEAYNPTQKTIVGRATYNVTPHKAGSYFAKIDCFCFTEQVLKPGERIDMPVIYYIDPSIDEDPNLDEVTEVTLSYTFFALEGEEAEEAIVASGR